MDFTKRRFVRIVAGAALFASGVIVGNFHAVRVAAQNRFGQPKTVLHVVV
jgi:hypothetical protein